MRRITSPKLNRKAIVHGHCHQKALDTLNDKEFGKLFAEKEIFNKMGSRSGTAESGCCGMAGAFGYEKENGHYEVAWRQGSECCPGSSRGGGRRIDCRRRLQLPGTNRAGNRSRRHAHGTGDANRDFGAAGCGGGPRRRLSTREIALGGGA